MCSCYALHTKLRTGSRAKLANRPSAGIVFATIQKFMPGEDEDIFPVLSDRHNIVVIADETHRTQYGFEAKLKTVKVRGTAAAVVSTGDGQAAPLQAELVPGSYLLTKGERHLYVGRSNNIRKRLQNHGRAGATHVQAAFAFRLAREACGVSKATYKPVTARSLLADQKDVALLSHPAAQNSPLQPQDSPVDNQLRTSIAPLPDAPKCLYLLGFSWSGWC